jgi:germination protein M
MKTFVSIALLTFATALALTGCGISRSEDPTPTASPAASATPSSAPSAASPSASPPSSPAASPTPDTVVSAYYLRGRFVGTAHRSVAATDQPAETALLELLIGPNAEERAAGLHTQIPAGTRLLGLTIRDGLATVDLSSEFAAGVDPREDRGRLAQVVYTLTQFPTVRGVRFRIDGAPLVFRSGEGTVQARPQTRQSFEDVTPAIFVEQPAVGDLADSPLVVAGTANTFEAQFMIRVRDESGASLASKSVTATSGTGTRGTFSEIVDFVTASTAITLEVYEQSPASGLPIHLIKIPLRLAGNSATP